MLYGVSISIVKMIMEVHVGSIIIGNCPEGGALFPDRLEIVEHIYSLMGRNLSYAEHIL